MAKPDKVVVINNKANKSAAFDRILNGVDLLADAVKLTLGPYGRNFLIEKSGGRITNDGISIAREIQAEDEIEELAVQIVREAAIKTNDDAGDGTTTSTTLAQAILHNCAEYMARGTQFATKSVVALKKQIEEECILAIEILEKLKTPIETKEQLIDVVRVSVEDEDLAKLIGDTQWELGKDGVITVEENTEPICEIERVRGIRIDNGLGTSMVMNDLEKQRLVSKNVPVFFTNYPLQTINSALESCINHFMQQGKMEIVFVARAYSSDVIKVIMENANKPGGIKIYPLQAPYINQREIMKDMEATLGGRYIHDEAATLDSVTPHDFGFAQQVIGYRYSARFIGQNDTATEERVLARVETLKKEYEGEPSKFQKKALAERIAMLESGFALLKVGSTSDVDRKYKLDKAEDAVNTARYALQEGTVPGAGRALVEIADKLADDSILKKPLHAPYNQIMENAGGTFDVPSWVRNAYVVDKYALMNACRVAQNLVTIGGAVAQKKQKPIDQLLRPITQENN